MVLTFCGKGGSGKSSLLKCLIRLVNISNGSIQVNDKALSSIENLYKDIISVVIYAGVDFV